MGISPGKKRTPGELIDIQGLRSSSSKNFHPYVLEVKQRQQVACLTEQDVPDKNQTQKGRGGSRGRKEYRDTVQVRRERARKAKVHLELSTVRDVKGKEKSFYTYLSHKRKIR